MCYRLVHLAIPYQLHYPLFLRYSHVLSVILTVYQHVHLPITRYHVRMVPIRCNVLHRVCLTQLLVHAHLRLPTLRSTFVFVLHLYQLLLFLTYLLLFLTYLLVLLFTVTLPLLYHYPTLRQLLAFITQQLTKFIVILLMLDQLLTHLYRLLFRLRHLSHRLRKLSRRFRILFQQLLHSVFIVEAYSRQAHTR